MKKPKKEKQTEVVYIRVTPTERARLREMAETHAMSEAAIIRDALAYYVPVTRKAVAS